jgi:XTP/dITP diphosphohydrolase
MITLLIATRNNHKVGEIRSILGDPFQCLALTALSEPPPEVVEDAATFAGNAAKKALDLAKWLAQRKEGKSGSGRLNVNSQSFAADGPSAIAYVLADDSGLEVDALGGAPGVHSARFAALDSGRPGNSTNAENNAKLLRLLKNVPPEKRTARFRCVLALTPVSAARPGVGGADEFAQRTEIFDGVCEGRIGLELRGNRGFGYDPLFYPSGFDQTFGELGEEVKNGLSHRARALEKLKQWLDQGAEPPLSR